MNSLLHPMTFKGEEEPAKGVGLVGTTYTLHTYGHHPPGFLTLITESDNPKQDILLRYRLQGHSTEDSVSDGGPEFAEVFVIVWVSKHQQLYVDMLLA